MRERCARIQALISAEIHEDWTLEVTERDVFKGPEMHVTIRIRAGRRNFRPYHRDFDPMISNRQMAEVVIEDLKEKQPFRPNSRELLYRRMSDEP
jgi:isocitrate dehydrogenase kinase/phosphatase